MKSAAILFCFVLAFSRAAAQYIITPADMAKGERDWLTAHLPISPTNRIELFNGTNLDGFTFCMTADADPAKTWIVTNGIIHCTGAAVGYLRTKQSYSNYVVTVVWRFIKVEPKKDNTGVMVHMQLPDQVWPMCIQNQGKSGRQGDLFVMAGAECKEHLALGQDANIPVALRGEPNENPVGEWNTNTTVCVGNDVKAIINGKLLNEITECTISSGFVGIQSEGADFEIRKISLNPTPDVAAQVLQKMFGSPGTNSPSKTKNPLIAN